MSYYPACAASGLMIRRSGAFAYGFLVTWESPWGEDDEIVWSVRSPAVFGTVAERGRFWPEDRATGAADSAILDAWLKVLDADRIERGTGDNSYHDVPVRNGADWEAVQKTISYRRLWVNGLDWEADLAEEAAEEASVFAKHLTPEQQEQFFPKQRKMPPWLPTLHSVEAALGSGSGYLIDEVFDGCAVRVRYEGYAPEGTRLDDAIPRLQAAGFAAVHTAGMGGYAWGGQLLVFAAQKEDWKEDVYGPPTVDWLPQVRRINTRRARGRVGLCLIHAGVWDAILAAKGEAREKTRAEMWERAAKLQRWTADRDIQRWARDHEHREIDRFFTRSGNYEFAGPGAHVRAMMQAGTWSRTACDAIADHAVVAQEMMEMGRPFQPSQVISDETETSFNAYAALIRKVAAADQKAYNAWLRALRG